MASNYYVMLEIHDEGEWPRIAPENLMQHIEVRLPSGLTVAETKVTEQPESQNCVQAENRENDRPPSEQFQVQ